MEKKDLNKLLKGRTADQKKVILYFLDEGGCLSTSIKDQEYEDMVLAIAKGTDFKQKALNKIGLDESQVNEIDPVHFEDYYFDEKRTYAKYGKDHKWRSSAYQISWLFFSSTQIYIYQYTYNMDEEGKKEGTEEYFYKDITNFSTVTDTVEKEIPVKSGCKGEVTNERKNVDTNRFAIVVPGDKFFCAMKQSDEAERTIQGMKAKLREKKG